MLVKIVPENSVWYIKIKALLPVIFLLAANSLLHAQTERYIQSLTGFLKANDSCTVTDDKFNDAQKWASIEKHRSVDNLITFELRYDTAANYLSRNFTCKLEADIEYEKEDHTKQQLKNIVLELNYDTAAGSTHQGIAYYKFTDGHNVKLTIKKINSAQWGKKLPPIFRIKNEIFIERTYTLNTGSTAQSVASFNGNEEAIAAMQTQRLSIAGGARINDIAGQQAILSWNPQDPALQGFSQYDLEWTFFDDYSTIATGLSNGSFAPGNASLETLFKNNSSRVTTGLSSYQLNLIYSKGFIFHRVRGVSYDEITGDRKEGAWSYAGSYNGWGIIAVTGHEEYLNWQYNMSFAEEGKRREVVSYFDGSLRNRQSVTLNNDITGSRTIVQENIFDALGRPAVNILPAPTEETNIHYFRGFNKSVFTNQPYNYKDIEEPGNCAKDPAALSTVSGASQYYSPDNPRKNDNSNQFYFTKYIPDAKGYPFSVTRFTPDNTGRIRTHGGVGQIFQPGKSVAADDHTTQYFYGKPQQDELDRLFGNEAGNASHYLKNMVIDANGQTSVSYINASGKTIATALTGKSPGNLHPLSSYQLKTTPFISTLTDRDNIVRDAANLTLTYSGTFLAAATGTFTLKYEFTPLSLQVLYGIQNEKICANCYYDLQINVSDNCGHLVQSTTQEAVFTEKTTCDPAPTTQQGQLPVAIQKTGEYNITYQLSLSHKAIDYYIDQYLVQNFSLKKEIDFKRDYIHKIDVSNCFNNCETCLSDIGTEQSFITKMTGVLQQADGITANDDDIAWMKTLYKNLLAECSLLQEGCGKTALPCEEQSIQLRDDVSPGGQYMLYDATTNTFIERDINVFLSIKNNNIVLPAVTLSNGSFKPLSSLTEAELITGWQDSWADILLPYHPENKNNCFIGDCGKNAESELYDKNFINTEDADMARAKHYWFDDDYTSVVNNDPYFKTVAEGAWKKTGFINSLGNFNGTGLDIMSFVRRKVYCPQPENNDQPGHLVNCPRNPGCNRQQDEWNVFKVLYYSAKQEIEDKNTNCTSKDLFPDPTTALQTPVDNTAAAPACAAVQLFSIINNNGTITIRYSGSQKIEQSVTVKYFAVNRSGTEVVAAAGNVVFAAGAADGDQKTINGIAGINYIIDYARCDIAHPYYTKDRRNYNGLQGASVSALVKTKTPDELNAGATADMIKECNESCEQDADGWMKKLEGCNLDINSAEYAQIRNGLIAVCKGSCEINVADHPFGASTLPTPDANGDKNFKDVLLRVLGGQRFTSVCNDLLLDYPVAADITPLYKNEIVQTLQSCAYEKLKLWQSAYQSATGYAGFADYIKKIIDPDFSLSDQDINSLMSAYENNCVTPKPLQLPASLSCNATQPKTCLTCAELQQEKLNFEAGYSFVAGEDPNYYELLAKYINRKYTFNLSSVDIYLALKNCITAGVNAFTDTISCEAFTNAYDHFEQLKPDYFSNPNGSSFNADSLYKIHLASWLNTALNRNFDFDYYNALSAKCGVSFDYPKENVIKLALDCDSLARLVSYYKDNLRSGGIRHTFNTQEGENFTDLHDLVNNGFIQLPDAIRQMPGAWYNNYQFDIRGGNFCTNDGYSVETQFKFLNADVLVGNAFCLGYRGIQAVFSRYALPFKSDGNDFPAGLYLTLVELNNYTNTSMPVERYGPDAGGAGFGYVLVDPDPDALLNPMDIKAIVKPSKYSLYYNGKMIYEHIRDASYPIGWQQNFGLMFRGRQGAVDWVRVGDANDATKYFENFNDADNPAFVDPSFICPQYQDCHTSFANYINSVLGANFTFDQYNDWSKSKCGKKINACENDSTVYTPRILSCCEPFDALEKFRQVYSDSVNARLLALYFSMQRSQWCAPVNLPDIDHALPYDSIVSYFNNYTLPACDSAPVQGGLIKLNNCYATNLLFQQEHAPANSLVYAICNKPAQPAVAVDSNSCINQQVSVALGNAHSDYLGYIEQTKRDYRAAYYTKCLSITPQLKLEAVYDQPLEYHYTLYYYDQAGNLAKTIPPAGVQPVDDAADGAAKMDRIKNFRLADKNYCYEYGDAPTMNGIASIAIGDNPLIQQNASPFTVEAFVRFNNTSSTQIILTKQSDNSIDGKIDGYKIYLDNGRLKVDMAAHGQEMWTQTLNKITQYTFPPAYNMPPVAVRTKVQVDVPRNLYRSLTAQVTSDISNLVSSNQWAYIAVENTGDWTNPVRIYINGSLVNSELVNNSYNYTPANSPPLTQADIAAGTTEFNFVYKASVAALNVSNANLANLVIGSSNNGINGSIKQVRIYNRELPVTEIRNNAFNTCLVPQSEGNLVLWLPLNKEETAGISLDRINQLATVNVNTVFSNLYQPVYPQHKLPTHYHYNSLNAVTRQLSPDGGQTNFWYDLLGRLVVSQNAEQLKSSPVRAEANNRYSYTKYDVLGRISEVGEKTGAATMTTAIAKTDPNISTSPINNWLASGTNIQVTQTIYDQPDVSVVTNSAITGNQNIYNTSRKRVVAMLYRNAITTAADYNSATHYEYDINGNVRRLWQEQKKSVTGAPINLLKELKYNYDLLSGKVNNVIYDEGKGDQFVYKYEYDPDNRLLKAHSGRDMNTLQQDAGYKYYLHGPLARMELGDALTNRIVQGSDYAYTLQGWMKGVNAGLLNTASDMGNDGGNVSAAGLGSQVASDAVAFTLGYYQNDYMPIGGNSSAPAFAVQYQHPNINDADLTGKDLFNGNISVASYAIAKIDNGLTHGYSYGYDQLNRLIEMRSHNLSAVTAGGAWNNGSILQDHKESYSYDANGNIISLVRNGTTAGGRKLAMDNLGYSYYYYNNANAQKTYTPGQPLPADAWALTNQLAQVKDAVAATNYPLSAFPDEKDIDNQANNNYTYDGIGNLVKDNAEGITKIGWTVYGKIKSIDKADGTKIVYDYDASGNRIQKQVISGNTKAITSYIRDAQGNIIAVYNWKGGSAAMPAAAAVAGNGLATQTWAEQHLYGSSRLGMWKPNLTVPATLNLTTGAVQVGSKFFELTNHLGNVLATISDKKVTVPVTNKPLLTDHYVAEIISAQDYTPFGMQMVGRNYSLTTTNYRYGFNGKENDDEAKGEGNQQDYGMRVYDPRLGRFLSVDPLTPKYPELTPYQFASNSPLSGIDLDGLEYSPAGKKGIFAIDGTAVQLYPNNPAVIVRQQKDAPVIRFNLMVQRACNGPQPYLIDASLALFQKNVSDPDNTGGSAAFQIYQDAKNSKAAYHQGNWVMGTVHALNAVINTVTLVGAGEFLGSKNGVEVKTESNIETSNKPFVPDQQTPSFANNVTLYRTQGGRSPNASWERIIVGPGGSISIKGNDMLYITLSDKNHQVYFYEKRGGAENGAYIASFEIPQDLANEIISNAVPQYQGKSFPNSPQISDPTKSPNAYGLPKKYIQKLREQVIQGSGKTEKPN